MNRKFVRILVTAILMVILCTTVQAQTASAAWLWGVPYVATDVSWQPWMMGAYLAAMALYSWYTNPANLQVIYDMNQNYYQMGGW